MNLKEYSRMLDYIDKRNVKDIDIVVTKILSTGEVVDCVKIYAQPSMKTKGMKNHIIKSSSIISKGTMKKDKIIPSDYDKQKVIDITSIAPAFNVGCPVATIPMKKLTIKDLTRFESIEDYKSSFSKSKKMNPSNILNSFSGNNEPPAISGHEYAKVYRAIYNYGASSHINVWNSSIVGNDFSLSQIWVVGGADSNLETVEAGTHVSYKMHGDYNSHLFIYFTPDNYQALPEDGGGCYNYDELVCNKFVQTNNNILIGGILSPASSSGSTQYEVKLEIKKDLTNNHWYIYVGDTELGYYPNSLFDPEGLKYQADRVGFGGEVYTEAVLTHTDTDMGSGQYPSAGWQYAAFQYQLKYNSTWNGVQDLTGATEIVTDSNCYDVAYTESTGTWGAYFYHGGPGKNINCP